MSLTASSGSDFLELTQATNGRTSIGDRSGVDARNMLQLAGCQEAFAISPIPIWIVDIESCAVLWANSPALDFWQAPSFEELAARDMLNAAPAPVLLRLRRAFERIKLGEIFEEDWTFYPKGKPMHVTLHLRPIRLLNGTVGMLNHATKLDEDTSTVTLRSLAMLRHVRATLVYVDAQGQILAQNALSAQEFGPAMDWTAWLTNKDTAEEIIRSALSGQLIQIEVPVQTTSGERIHSILAHELRDPASGKLGVLIQHFDVTERVQAETTIQAHVARLQEKNDEIRKLSTPFLDVGARTLALPIIGRIDESRATDIASRLLELVVQRNIEQVILDITGVESVDAEHLTFIRRLADAVKLLGARPIVTGIRGELARMLATSDENLAGIAVKRSLADGLAAWRNRQGKLS